MMDLWFYEFIGDRIERLESNMIVSANQPYFAPFPGFFYKAHLSDAFIVLDDVQFPRGTTWITRNRIKNDRGELWITIPVRKKGLGLQKISEVRIYQEGRWAKKHLDSFNQAYANTPYFPEHINFIETIFSSPCERLIDFNMKIINYLIKALKVNTKVVLLSELGIEAKGDRLLIEICKETGASCFLAQSGAKKYLNADLFLETRIRLEYFTVPKPIYPQLWGSFISNLSSFDLLFNCGPKAHDILTDASAKKKVFKGAKYPVFP